VLRPRRGDDPRVRGLSLRASGLLFRLLLCRSCTTFGAILGGPGALAEECGGADSKEFSEAFAELEKSGLVEADWQNRICFVTFVPEDDPPVNENMAKGRGRAVGDLPDCNLRRKIVAEILKHAGPWADEFSKAAANFGGVDTDEEPQEDEPEGTVSKPFGNRSGTVRRPS